MKKIIIFMCVIIIIILIGFNYYNSNKYTTTYQGIVALKKENRILVVSGLSFKQLYHKSEREILNKISQSSNVHSTAGWIKVDKNTLNNVSIGDKVKVYSRNAYKDILPFQMNADKVEILK